MRRRNPSCRLGGRAWLATACAFVLAGCVHEIKPEHAPPRTKVAYKASVDPQATHYEEKDDESTTIPQPGDNPPPVYPPSMIALHLPLVMVKAKLIFGAQGTVEEVRIVPADPASPRPVEFDEAVRDAVRGWFYTPLTFTRWEEVKDAEGNIVDSRPASIEKKPFSLDFDFRFELRDGKPVVGAMTRHN
ncbi:MAG: hypothetical protein J0I77_16365 [Rudaea sp.]|uniref:hypothetical protein n=1 Tax=unclassified Rudaea TaxID=2627037 RepID=UPI0010F4C14D|nr:MULTISPECIES: hypothetical protein [unclassified Rudaea]MBN8887298.1 hypothetical protein [Rudaea sp.]